MTDDAPNGRWVILTGDDAPPVFSSASREVLEQVCRRIHPLCPTARVVWQEAGTRTTSAANGAARYAAAHCAKSNTPHH